MKFKERLLQGSLEKRYKRFFIDIKYKGKSITAHCPNTGSMLGLLDKNNKIWFSKSDNKKRKLKYTAEIIEVNGKKVGINTHFTNKIVLDALKNKKIDALNKYDNIKPESKFTSETRFDFLLSNKKEKCFLEVKNVTLIRKNKIAEFPDAITARGLKHLNDLCKAKREGFKSYILYLIQREGCNTFKIANDIDKLYKIGFTKALKSGVKVLCYDCKLNDEEIKLNKQIFYE
jgi:sugar fermentation stimulation protein A